MLGSLFVVKKAKQLQSFLLQSSSVAGGILQPRTLVSPNFSSEDASAYINSFQHMVPWPCLSAFPRFPLSLPTSFCSSGPLQLATDSLYQGILMVAESQMETVELLPHNLPSPSLSPSGCSAFQQIQQLYSLPGEPPVFNSTEEPEVWFQRPFQCRSAQ